MEIEESRVAKSRMANRANVRSDAAASSLLTTRYSLLAQDIARSWIGTPYVHQASVKGAGCDCLGLLRGVFRELRGEEAETPPPYSPDWAESNCAETLYSALLRHLSEIELAELSPGDIALFRMHPRGPAKHCGIIALKQRSGSASKDSCHLSLIHARQNKRVSEEAFTPPWRKKLAFAFRL